jgi:hypothetical protein
MSTTRSIAVLVVAVLLAVPSAAIAVGKPPVPGNGHKPAGTPAPSKDTSPSSTPNAGTPGPDARPGVKAKAYGRLCQGESKKHVAGQKGTPFSQCVTAMAKAASGEGKSARAACAGLSRKHTRGERGTPFSRCVSAARKIVGSA